MRISDWSSDVCSSDLQRGADQRHHDDPFDTVAGAKIRPDPRKRPGTATQGDNHRNPKRDEAPAALRSPVNFCALFGAGIESRLDIARNQAVDFRKQGLGFKIGLRPFGSRDGSDDVAVNQRRLNETPYRKQQQRSEEHTSELPSLKRI